MINLFKTITNVFSSRWRLLIGKPSDFVLEARVFHSISLGIAVLITCYIPYDAFAGMYIASVSSAVVAAFFGYEYYRSRFMRRPHRSLAFGLFGLVILPVNYFANSGIQGSTDLMWPVYLLMLLTICPLRNQLGWVASYLVIFGLVHVAEYQHPEWVRYPFRPGLGQFTDRITAFPIPVLSMAIIIGLFRRSYEKERNTVAQRDTEKGRLLSILSHDLRTPFIQVKQYLELLGENSLTQQERIDMEQSLRDSNNQTLDLVTNLLYWSRSQLDGSTVHLAELPLADTIDNTLAMARVTARKKGITLETNIEPTIRVLADADMLQLVVRNLLQNAIKFTSAGGVIKIAAILTENCCCLSINDTGGGMEPEQLATLFTGTAAPAHGTANEKGVGLGLQLCHEFMERQGGTISVESEIGKGSKFSIELPIAI
ncbi:sensor histidine kinase [Mucilaginibacter ximonensis]|uniref:histidine kinase n=1 Tax=Mucilaginibacter ximonensis TaxID=538021 RepID=A0ABW5YCN6_9SPHI